jgi:hypothetical protein
VKTALATAVTALSALVVVVLASASWEPHVSGRSRAEQVAPSPGGSPPPATGALPGPLEGNAASQPQVGTSSPRSEPLSDDAPEGAAAPGPAVLPPPDDQVAALQQLIAQSREENEQLGQIDDRLAALQQQTADDESLRQSEAEQEAEQHAATLDALATLRRAEAQLEAGDSDGVDDELGQAEAALSGRTRLDVEAAREALARSDLFPAREYLAAALAERRIPR